MPWSDTTVGCWSRREGSRRKSRADKRRTDRCASCRCRRPGDEGQAPQAAEPEFYGETAWSPDGRRIAFIGNRDRNPDIDLISPDGSGQTTLTGSKADDLFPAWSPDGRWIAFETNRDGHYEI